jgi:hypothetical protein
MRQVVGQVSLFMLPPTVMPEPMTLPPAAPLGDADPGDCEWVAFMGGNVRLLQRCKFPAQSARSAKQ